MTVEAPQVLDELGEPVVVELVEEGLPFLASGWHGGVGRYADGATAAEALERWAAGELLPIPSAPPVEEVAEHVLQTAALIPDDRGGVEAHLRDSARELLELRRLGPRLEVVFLELAAAVRNLEAEVARVRRKVSPPGAQLELEARRTRCGRCRGIGHNRRTCPADLEGDT